jgi:hypothetical protein
MNRPSYKRSHGLTIAQQNAIDLLAAGATDVFAAGAVGVKQNTVTKWRNYDPLFQTALNTRRAEQWAGLGDSLRTMLPAAFDTIRDQLRVGPNRGRLALDLVTRAGLMGRPASGALGASGGAAAPANPVGIGFTRLEDLLDAEVRRARAAMAAALGEEPDAGPITDDDRDAAFEYLRAQATDEEDETSALGESDHEAEPPASVMELRPAAMAPEQPAGPQVVSTMSAFR